MLDNEGIKLIQDYNWPGNIRELKNFVQNLSVLEKEKNISKSRLLLSFFKKSKFTDY